METKSPKLKGQTHINLEEQHLVQMSLDAATTATTTTIISKKKKIIAKKQLTIETAATATTTTNEECNHSAAATTTLKKISKSKQQLKQQEQQKQQLLQKQEEIVEQKELQQQQQIDHEHNNLIKKEKSCRKQKKEKQQQQQMYKSVKTSFSKFDALERRELIHNGQNERQTSTDCRLCQKPVYKMEEVKAEKSIYHRNCFRCHECSKPLKVDNYQSHEGTLYCIVHFKLLFAPKSIEDAEPERPRKVEMIIRENQPIELPPDVARSSDKPDLGLAELQQLNLRSKFQIFESGNAANDQQQQQQQQHVKLTRNVSLQTKLAKLQSHGLNTNGKVRSKQNDDGERNDDDGDNDANDDVEDDVDNNDEDDLDALHIDYPKRERPIGLGYAMNDIKTKFERGHAATKEERREERKQELQNIRSRLFMGKQARIKEMYQQAVAESEQGITSAGKKIDLEITKPTQLIKNRFETGNIYGNHKYNDSNDDDEVDEMDENCQRTPLSASTIQNDADLFESAISKQSRNIFMELDANLNANERNSNHNIKQQQSNASKQLKKQPNDESTATTQRIIKCSETDEQNDVEAIPSTNELSEKFKFFETYQPQTPQRKQFRITPPRDGVVKMPTPPSNDNNNDDNDGNDDDDDEKYLIEKSQTTSRMLNKFRQIEQQNRAHNGVVDHTPKPLKRFTPPPDGERAYYQNVDSDYDDFEDDDDDDNDHDDDDDNNDLDDKNVDDHEHYQKAILNDAALQEAKALARTQQLRKKFEKWENDEKERERNENPIDVYSKDISDDTNIESTKTIRQHFENLRNIQTNPTSKVRYQVNRFV